MIVFEITYNGNVVARAGADTASVLSHTISAMGKLGDRSRSTELLQDGYAIHGSATGICNSPDEPESFHVTWVDQPLKVGDEFTIRILDADNADIPERTKPMTPRDED